MAFCRNCGAQLQPDEKFCQSCGTKVEGPDTQAAAGAAAAVTAAEAAEPAQDYQSEAYPQQDYQPEPEPVYQAAPEPDYQQPDSQTYEEPPVYDAAASAAESDADIAANKGMSALAYIGVLVLIPLFARKDSYYARFHTNQGLVLMFIEIVSSLVNKLSAAYLPASVNSTVSTICLIISLATIVLSIMGIVNAVKGRYKSLPLIGGIKII